MIPNLHTSLKINQNKKKLIALFFILLLSLSALSGCAGKTNASNDTDTFRIVTSFYPVYVLTSSITEGANGVTIDNMAAPQTGCLHDYQLTTGNLKEIGAADCLIINGAHMESFLEKAISLYPDLQILDSSLHTELIPLDGGHHHSSEEENHEEEFNSHIWLSPANALIQAENIKNGLIEANPQNAELYEQNFISFQNKSIPLIEKYASLPASGQKAGIFHEGFGYFTEACGLEVDLAIYTDENQLPSARELAEAANTIQKEQITILLTANDQGLQFAETLSKETGVPYYILDPVTSGDFSLDSYFDTMEHNYEILLEALK